MSKRIKVQSSNSPLGGGSVRVYVGDKLVWTKRADDLNELFNIESAVHRHITQMKVLKKQYGKLLRLV